MKSAITQLLVSAVTAATTSAWAEMVTIPVLKDAAIFGGFVSNSNGGGPGMFAGADGNGRPSRALLAFDLAGNVPSGATITDVQLILALGTVAGGGGSPGPNPVTIGIHRLTSDWGEGTTGNDFDVISGTGNGFPANPGDATWNARNFPGTLWSTDGGDFQPTASASLSVGNVLTTIDNNTFYTWASIPMIVDMQGWLDGANPNYGWMMINTNETSARTFRAFYTREYDIAGLQPKLQVTFTVPEPGGFSLSAFAVAILFLIRRFKRSGND